MIIFDILFLSIARENMAGNCAALAIIDSNHDSIFRAIFQVFLREDCRRAIAFAFAFYHVPSGRFKANEGLLYKRNSAARALSCSQIAFYSRFIQLVRSLAISVPRFSRPFLIPATVTLFNESTPRAFACEDLFFSRCNHIVLLWKAS